MKITEIQDEGKARIFQPRCQSLTKSGQPYMTPHGWKTKESRCRHGARYEVDGVKLCTYHAGNFALGHLLRGGE